MKKLEMRIAITIACIALSAPTTSARSLALNAVACTENRPEQSDPNFVGPTAPDRHVVSGIGTISFDFVEANVYLKDIKLTIKTNSHFDITNDDGDTIMMDSLIYWPLQENEELFGTYIVTYTSEFVGSKKIHTVDRFRLHLIEE